MEAPHPDPFSAIYGTSDATQQGGPTDKPPRPQFIHLRNYSDDSGISRTSSSASVTIRPGQYYDQPFQAGQFTPTSEISSATPPNVAKTNQDGTDPPVPGADQIHPQTRQLSNKGATFLVKLFMLLDDPHYSHLLHWSEDGKQVVIEKPLELEASVLPRIYKQSKFSSFSRQLNIYGFTRKVFIRDRQNGEGDLSAWIHPYLNKWSTDDEVMTYRRRLPGQPQPSAADGEEAKASAPSASSRRPSGPKQVSRAPGSAIGSAPRSPASMAGRSHHHSPYNAPRPIASSARATATPVSSSGYSTPGTAILVRDPATGVFRWSTIGAAGSPTATTNTPFWATPLSPDSRNIIEGSRQEVAQAWTQAMQATRNPQGHAAAGSTGATGAAPISAPAWHPTFPPSHGGLVSQQQSWPAAASPATTTTLSPSFPYLPATPWSVLQNTSGATSQPQSYSQARTHPHAPHAIKPYDYFGAQPTSHTPDSYPTLSNSPSSSTSSFTWQRHQPPSHSRPQQQQPYRHSSLSVSHSGETSYAPPSTDFSHVPSALPTPRHEILSQVPQTRLGLGPGIGLETGLGAAAAANTASADGTGAVQGSITGSHPYTFSHTAQGSYERASGPSQHNYITQSSQGGYRRSYTPSPTGSASSATATGAPAPAISVTPRYHIAFGNGGGREATLGGADGGTVARFEMMPPPSNPSSNQHAHEHLAAPQAQQAEIVQPSGNDGDGDDGANAEEQAGQAHTYPHHDEQHDDDGGYHFTEMDTHMHDTEGQVGADADADEDYDAPLPASVISMSTSTSTREPPSTSQHERVYEHQSAPSDEHTYEQPSDSSERHDPQQQQQQQQQQQHVVEQQQGEKYDPPDTAMTTSTTSGGSGSTTTRRQRQRGTYEPPETGAAAPPCGASGPASEWEAHASNMSG